jgi:CRP-like cAMP-binding protein
VSLDNDIRQLSFCPIFGHLDFEAKRLLAFSAETKILRAGDVLFQRGEKSDCAYFILRGSIALDFSTEKARAVQIVGPQHLIGELALLVETERPAVALAREPSTVLKIPRLLFHRVLEEYPESAASIRSAVGSRLSTFVDELQRLRSGLQKRSDR